MLSEDQVVIAWLKSVSDVDKITLSVKWVDDSNRILINTELENTREPEEGRERVFFGDELKLNLIKRILSMMANLTGLIYEVRESAHLQQTHIW